jgi:deazaflavin-dependent oxidoreductase (nitroreductase family)
MTNRPYKRPGWFVKNVGNPLVAFLSGRLGMNLRGARVLAVRGRRSGRWRTTPVNPLTVEGRRYLVSPRGETDWVRNLRAAGEGELRLGNRVQRFRATEIPDAEKPPILRAYLRQWAWETGPLFDVSGPDVPDSELARIAPNHPVFRITRA